MKKCLNYETCNNMINDNYKYCQECNEKWKKKEKEGDTPLLKKLNEIQQSLEFNLKHLNWNAGIIAKCLKFYLLMNLEKEGHESETRNKIYNLLIKDFDKDVKVVKDIRQEEEGNGTK